MHKQSRKNACRQKGSKEEGVKNKSDKENVEFFHFRKIVNVLLKTMYQGVEEPPEEESKKRRDGGHRLSPAQNV